MTNIDDALAYIKLAPTTPEMYLGLRLVSLAFGIAELLGIVPISSVGTFGD